RLAALREQVVERLRPRPPLGAERDPALDARGAAHALGHRQERVADEHRRRVGVVEDVGDLLGGEAVVHRHPDGPERAEGGAGRARRDGRRRRRYALRVRWPAALLLVLIAALPAAHAQPARWRGTGVVVAVLPAPSSLHATRPVIVLDHQPIAGLMEQRMSMPFIAASADLFRGIKAGDHVAFALAETPDALLVVSLERLGP